MNEKISFAFKSACLGRGLRGGGGGGEAYGRKKILSSVKLCEITKIITLKRVSTGDSQ